MLPELQYKAPYSFTIKQPHEKNKHNKPKNRNKPVNPFLPFTKTIKKKFPILNPSSNIYKTSILHACSSLSCFKGTSKVLMYFIDYNSKTAPL